MEPEWADRLLEHRKAYDKASAAVEELQVLLRQRVVEFSDDPTIHLADLAVAVGWTVSYIRSLRGRYSVVDRTRMAEYAPIPAAAKAEIRQIQDEIERAERRRSVIKGEYIEYIRTLTSPAPSMREVADVLGLTHQRVSQLLLSA